MIILAMDLCKYNSMCRFFDTKSQQCEFLNSATTRSYVRSLFQNRQIDLVVMEACGPSGWICDLCEELGLRVLLRYARVS